MIGSTLSHYRILDKLGEGGMGVVYRAHDTRLERDVAVKVLPAGTLADDAARKRFRKEALALSKLDHPNIETVYDFDTQEGVDFLVMQYIPGETLDAKLASGPLPEKEVARLGAQITEGLAAAHAQGIVHRDLKPGNLVVTPDGRVKILDFGLAKLLPIAGEMSRVDTMSHSGSTAGTVPYMAPEQLRGEAADARTDIWALGVTLYEMASGQRPFRGETQATLSDAILHQATVTPRAINTLVSPDLERVILKCLNKEPERRYQSAKEVGVDLRQPVPSEPTPPSPTPPKSGKWMRPLMAAVALALVATVTYWLLKPGPPTPTSQAQQQASKIMLAVLPFDNLSADPEQEYFSDGMTEEMIAHLGRLAPKQLGVIARTSVMRFKDTDEGIGEIGLALGVDHILEGSVRRAAERVRITAQLIQVSDETHLWAESYERDLGDVFAVQNDVAERVAESLKLELLPAREAQPINPEAHEAYLKGRYFWNKRTQEALQKSLEYFQSAIEKEPTFAPAYAGIADYFNMLGFYDYLPSGEAFPKAKAAAEKALEIDETLAEAHVSLAYVKTHYEWDWEGAELEFKRAIELNPSYVTAHFWYAGYLSGMGRFDESIAAYRTALELDPLSIMTNTYFGGILYTVHEDDLAIEQLQKSLELDPSLYIPHHLLAYVYSSKGMHDEAIAEAQDAMELSGGMEPSSTLLLGYVYAVAGKQEGAEQALSTLLDLSKQMYVPPAGIAAIYVGLGQKDEAFKWLEKAYKERDHWMYLLKVNRPFYILRDDPRFDDLLQRMDFPPD